jgi:curli biogenesis system outer membrane secretion channel CsgG
MRYLKYLGICLIIIYGCYSYGPYVNFDRSFSLSDSSSTMAVLNFEYGGNFLSSQIALQAADNLTSEIFIKKDIQVVDRSLVKDVLKKYEKTKPSLLSKEEISKIGQDLQANYLILGSIQSIGSIDQYYDSRDYNVEITLRIVDVKDGKVVGIIRHQREDNSDIQVLVNRIIRDMVFHMREWIHLA